MKEITLEGCSAENLMGYLKALGIFRIVAGQKEPTIKARWKGQHFCLLSEEMSSPEELREFLLNKYKPSPIASPWNGGSGFYKSDISARKNIQTLLESSRERLSNYQAVIRKIHRIQEELEISEKKPDDNLKSLLISTLRARMPDDFIRWIDSAMALLSTRQDYLPLLGSGGNDGRMDFAKSFIDNLLLADIHETPDATSQKWLAASLFATPVNRLKKGPVGQFYPGRRGGANAISTGYERDSVVNPWDYLFNLEGTLMFSSAVTKKYLSEEGSSFAFTIRHIPLGTTESVSGQDAQSRGEIWLPAWQRWAGIEEVTHLFQEGRAEVKQHLVTTTSDFARAVAGLQVDRGLESFYRFSFFERHGQSHLAVLQDHFKVPDREIKHLDLFDELDIWLNRYRRYLSGNKTASEQKKRLYQKIENLLYNYCKTEKNRYLTQLLIELGEAEQNLARSASKRDPNKIFPSPLSLSAAWAPACYDGSVEYRIALSIASLLPAQNQKPIRCYFENVSENGRSWLTEEKNTITHSSNLYVNLNEILRRRLLESEKSHDGGYAIGQKGGYPLSHVDFQQFLEGNFHKEKTLQFLYGLMLINWTSFPFITSKDPSDIPFLLSSEIAALKLLFLTDDTRLVIPDTEKHVPIETSVPSLLLAHNYRRALDLCRRRLSYSGYPFPSLEKDFTPAYRAQNMTSSLLLPLKRTTVDLFCKKLHIKKQQYQEA